GGFLPQGVPGRGTATLLEQVRRIVAALYVDTLPSGSLNEKAARGLVRELNDPYSELPSPRQSEDFDRGTNGRYGGTGMFSGESRGAVIVDRVFPNTPADEAG